MILNIFPGDLSRSVSATVYRRIHVFTNESELIKTSDGLAEFLLITLVSLDWPTVKTGQVIPEIIHSASIQMPLKNVYCKFEF